MITKYVHIIQTQNIEISYESLDDAFGIQDRIAELFYERIQPKMDTMFDELFGKDHIAYIERLEIDCGVLPKKNWEEEWVDVTLRKLKEQLRQADIKKKTISDISEIFYFYLQHGSLPWNSRIKSTLQLEQELVIDHSFILSLREIINQWPVASKRLAYKFSAGFRKKLSQHFIEQSGTKTRIIKELIRQLDEQKIKQEIVDEAVLQILCSPIEFEDEKLAEIVLLKILQQAPGNDQAIAEEIKKSRPKTMEEKSDKKNHSLTKENDIVYINNAGLVILHPFLPQFFEQLQFCQQGKWKDESMQQQAAIILEYIATGIEEPEEFNLSLPKIICGIIPETVTTVDGFITDEIKETCEELLRQIITHWSALKNTGTVAFRHTFLQRNGKLSTVNDGWLLQVEQQGVDILLDSLPWGIGTIKLPWMKEIIYTEW